MFLDTSFCIDLMRERGRGVRGPATKKLEELRDTPLQVSLFVACELQAGASLSSRPREELRRVEKLLDLMELVLPDRSFAVAYGEVEASLRKRGRPIPTMDLLIGLLAKIHGVPLLTGDPEHSVKIPGLVVETY